MELVSRTLRKFHLTDEDGLIDLFANGSPSLSDVTTHLRRSHALLPPTVSAEFLAEAILNELEGVQPDPPDVLELSCWEIDQFSRFQNRAAGNVQLPVLKPEVEIKERICFLLGVTDVPKDWGGESHDLFANVTVSGRSLPAAFFFKGKSVRRPLQIKDCGTNGDQLLRLMESSASIFVVQHIHTISDSVRKQMVHNIIARRSTGRESWCVFIDGYQIACLLEI